MEIQGNSRAVSIVALTGAKCKSSFETKKITLAIKHAPFIITSDPTPATNSICARKSSLFSINTFGD